MKRILYAWAAIVAIGSVAHARGDAVTLDEFLGRLESHHPYIEREALQSEIDAQTSRGLRGREDWVLTGSPSFTHQEPLATSAFTPERVEALSVSAGASRTFWNSGSRLSLGWTSDVTSQDLPVISVPGPSGPIDIPIGPSTYYENTIRATVALPLWKNRGGDLDRLAYDLSRFDVDVAGVVSLENREGFLLGAAILFVDWALAGEQLRIARDRLALAGEELNRTRRKREANLVDEADVARAEDAVHVARGAVLLTEVGYEAIRTRLATISAWSRLYDAAPSMDLYDITELGATPQSIGRAVRSSRLVETLRIQRRRLALAESGAADATHPELALSVSGVLKGGDSGFGSSLEIKEPDITVGVQFAYPLGNRGARADLEKTRLQARQLDLAIRDVELNLEANVRDVLVRASRLRAAIANDRETVETARRRTREELRLYQQGRGDLTFVIQSRDREATSRAAYAENSASYRKLTLRYRALVDRLFAPQ